MPVQSAWPTLEAKASTGSLSASSATANRPRSGSQKRSWKRSRSSAARTGHRGPSAGRRASASRRAPARGVGVGLHLDQGDRRLGERPSAKLMPSTESFQPWLSRPAMSHAGTRRSRHRRGRRTARSTRALDRRAGAAPATASVGLPTGRARRARSRTGRGVSGAVVAVPLPRRERAGRTEAQLVHDAPGLFLRGRVVLTVPGRPPGSAASPGRGLVQREQHQGGQQGVTAEQGHEPGRPGGDDSALRMRGIEDAQSPEILHAATQQRREVRIGGPNLRALFRQACSRRAGRRLTSRPRGWCSAHATAGDTGRRHADPPTRRGPGRARPTQPSVMCLRLAVSAHRDRVAARPAPTSTSTPGARLRCRERRCRGRPSLTANRSAKSAPTARQTRQVAAGRPVAKTRSSRMPSPT